MNVPLKKVGYKVGPDPIVINGGYITTISRAKFHPSQRHLLFNGSAISRGPNGHPITIAIFLRTQGSMIPIHRGNEVVGRLIQL